MTAIRTLVDVLSRRRDPATVGEGDWAALLSVARAEALAGSLAFAAQGAAVPVGVAAMLSDIRDASDIATRAALWEAEMIRRALAPAGIVPVLMKGTAYAALDRPWARGRQIGDTDIMVAERDLPAAERALLDAGWEWVKSDPYDEDYYRRWMHELPPLIHRDRDRMVDVHHRILPRTHRSRAAPEPMLARAVPAGAGLMALDPADRVIQAAAHLFDDGDFQGGLRNLFDLDGLLRDLSDADWPALRQRADAMRLTKPVARAVQLAARIWGTPVVGAWPKGAGMDDAIERRLFARDDWGRETAKGLRFAFYARGHWLRMPPLMLARHLLTKATKR